MTEDFLIARRTGIGGSDIGAILGISPYKTPVDVYCAKTDPGFTEEDNELFYWGHALEQPIAERFERDHKISVIRNVPIARHPEHEWMVANVDGIINDGERGILEIKTVGAFAGKEWGEEGSDNVPLTYIAQCVWYMAIMGYEYSIVAALFGGNQYKEFRIPRDRELEAALIQKGKDFWFNNVLQKIPPPITSVNDAIRLFKQDNGKTIECSEEVFQSWQKLKSAKSQAKELETNIGELETAIKVAMCEAAILTYQGQTLATWKTQSANRLDIKTLEAVYPDIAAKFRKVSETRVLRLK